MPRWQSGARPPWWPPAFALSRPFEGRGDCSHRIQAGSAFPTTSCQSFRTARCYRPTVLMFRAMPSCFLRTEAAHTAARAPDAAFGNDPHPLVQFARQSPRPPSSESARRRHVFRQPANVPRKQSGVPTTSRPAYAPGARHTATSGRVALARAPERSQPPLVPGAPRPEPVARLDTSPVYATTGIARDAFPR